MITVGKYYRIKNLEEFKAINKRVSGSPYFGAPPKFIQQLADRRHKCLYINKEPGNIRVSIYFEVLGHWFFLEDVLHLFEEETSFVCEEMEI